MVQIGILKHFIRIFALNFVACDEVFYSDQVMNDGRTEAQKIIIIKKTKLFR